MRALRRGGGGAFVDLGGNEAADVAVVEEAE